MIRLNRGVAAVAAPLILSVALAGCGDSDGAKDGGDAKEAPKSATTQEFCEVYLAPPELPDNASDLEPAEQAKAYKDAFDGIAKDLTDVGTPEDMPDDAREGYEILVKTLQDLDEGQLQKAIEEQDGEFLENQVSDDENKKVTSFTDWATESCAEFSTPAPGAPGATPSS